MLLRGLWQGESMSWGQKGKRKASAAKPAVTSEDLRAQPRGQASMPSLAIEMEPMSKAQRRRRRREIRKKTAEEHHPMEGQTVLQQASVSKECRVRYHRHWSETRRLVVSASGEPLDAKTVDANLTKHLEEIYMDGEDLSTARYVIAAILFFVPMLRAPGMINLPRVRQSLSGWQKLCPPRSRLPIPFEVVVLMAVTALKKSQLQMGIYLLLTFALYLRPNEGLRLRKKDLVCPSSRKEGYQHWTVVLHPLELGTSSKTQEFDECLQLDLPYHKHFGEAAYRLLGLCKKGPEDLIFSITNAEVAAFMESASKSLNLQALGPLHPYRLRHGGASHDFNSKLRDLPAIQLRGRWKTQASVRRYQKGGRVSQLFKGLPKAVRLAAKSAVQQLPGLLAKRR